MKILYEDNHLIGVVKPAGILAQGDGSDARDMLTILSSYLKEKYQKPGNAFVGLVHRLDRNVGGTMVFAKTSKGASRLSASMREGRFFKGYFALAKGKTPAAEGILVNRLWKDERRNQVFERPEGKLSRLFYRRIAQVNGVNLYFAVPVTGRTHQIRAQFALNGAPLVGDSKYGSCREAGQPIGLWSAVIEVAHPVKQERVLLTSTPEGGPWDCYSGVLPFLNEFWDGFDVTVYRRAAEMEEAHGI